jgi:hypothetical protein
MQFINTIVHLFIIYIFELFSPIIGQVIGLNDDLKEKDKEIKNCSKSFYDIFLI